MTPPKKVPRMLPADESAEKRPTVPPEVSTSSIARRTTKGETMPRSRLGMAKISRAARTDTR